MRTPLCLGTNDSSSIPRSESIAEAAVAVSTDFNARDHALSSSTDSTEPQNAYIQELSADETEYSTSKYVQRNQYDAHGCMAAPETNAGVLKRPDALPSPSSIGRAASFDADEVPTNSRHERAPETEKKKAVGWRDLPKKGQLAILTLARLSEPLAQTSLQSYMFHQLRSFDPSLQDSAISSQVGILQGCFTFAQFMTAVMWGRISDAEWGGRKRVILIGLLGTGISCVGFGFSRSFATAVVFRTLGGVLNGNVGVLKTMISEIVKEKKFRSRAFLLLPMCFNIGVIIGPVLGGVLADPVGNYSRVFGEDSLVGGKNGVWWLKHWPYALPNLMSAIFIFLSASAVLLGLEETHESLEGRPDWGLTLGHSIASLYRRLFKRHSAYGYAPLNHTDDETPPNSATYAHTDSYELESSPISNHIPEPKKAKKKKKKKKASFRSIFTPTVLITLLSYFLLALHISTFNSLWFIFLSTPRSPTPTSTSTPTHSSFLNFTGGLALQPRTIGLALAILGSIGLPLQLGLYPRVSAHYGTLTPWRIALLCFPISYTLAPFLATVPTSHPPPHEADGPYLWLALLGVLAVQVLGRTFALPGAIILVNDCSPSRSVLGTLHGVAQSVSSAARTAGPVLGAWGFGRGLDVGVVGAVWWGLACVAVVGCVAGGFVREGEGGEGEDEDVVEEVEGEGEKDGLVDGEEGRRRGGGE